MKAGHVVWLRDDHGLVARVGALHFRMDDHARLQVWAGLHAGWVLARNLAQLSAVLVDASTLTPPGLQS